MSGDGMSDARRETRAECREHIRHVARRECGYEPACIDGRPNDDPATCFTCTFALSLLDGYP